MSNRTHVRYGPSCHRTFIDSFASLRQFGRRSLLALLGIGIGCASVIAMLNIGQNATNEALSVFRGLGTNMMLAGFSSQRTVGKNASVSLDVSKLREALPAITNVAPLALFSTEVRHAGESGSALVVGTTSGMASILDIHMSRGRFLSGYDDLSRHVVVGDKIAKELNIETGSQLEVGAYLLEVIGIADSQATNFFIPVAVDVSIMVPIEGMRRLMPNPQIGSIIAEVHDTDRIEWHADELRTYLESIFDDRSVDVQIPQHLLDQLTRPSYSRPSYSRPRHKHHARRDERYYRPHDRRRAGYSRPHRSRWERDGVIEIRLSRVLPRW